jgi:hypothetical protein
MKQTAVAEERGDASRFVLRGRRMTEIYRAAAHTCGPALPGWDVFGSGDCNKQLTRKDRSISPFCIWAYI